MCGLLGGSAAVGGIVEGPSEPDQRDLTPQIMAVKARTAATTQRPHLRFLGEGPRVGRLAITWRRFLRLFFTVFHTKGTRSVTAVSVPTIADTWRVVKQSRRTHETKDREPAPGDSLRRPRLTGALHTERRKRPAYWLTEQAYCCLTAACHTDQFGRPTCQRPQTARS